MCNYASRRQKIFTVVANIYILLRRSLVPRFLPPQYRVRFPRPHPHSPNCAPPNCASRISFPSSPGRMAPLPCTRPQPDATRRQCVRWSRREPTYMPRMCVDQGRGCEQEGRSAAPQGGGVWGVAGVQKQCAVRIRVAVLLRGLVPHGPYRHHRYSASPPAALTRPAACYCPASTRCLRPLQQVNRHPCSPHNAR
jgi:hypothetical protein